MAGTDQPDDNETEMQTDLFAAEPVPAYRPDPERVRARLHKILAEAIPSAAAGKRSSSALRYGVALAARGEMQTL